MAALTARVDSAYNAGRYAEAVPLAERLVALSRERYGEADPRYAAALNGLATLLQNTGALDRAEQLLRRSLEIDLSALGPDHPETVTRRANLALVLLDEDKTAEAADLLQQALASLDKQPAASGRDGPTLSNFAAALERLNRVDDAERLYRAAIAAFRQQPAENAARLAVTLGNLGILCKSQHRLGEARPLLQEALDILEGLSKPDAPHPRLATALNNLATLLDDAGEYGPAETLYRRALDTDRAMFGPDNPRLATRLSNLANMHINQGRFDEARGDLREAMRIDRAAYGDDHPRVASLFLAAARLLSAEKKWEGANTMISRASDIMIEADARRGLVQGRVAAGRAIPDVTLSQIIYTTFLQISGEWPWSDHSQFAKLGGPAFDVAQRLTTTAAATAIARMASRYARATPASPTRSGVSRSWASNGMPPKAGSSRNWPRPPRTAPRIRLPLTGRSRPSWTSSSRR